MRETKDFRCSHVNIKKITVKNLRGHRTQKYFCTKCNTEMSVQYKNISKQPEETMSDKMQMTDKEFDYLCDNFFPVDREMREIIRQQMLDADVIIKSEIEQKIEEVEEMYKDESCDFSTLVRKLHETIQLLKPYYYSSKEEKK